MIPLRDTQPSRTVPVVTIGIIVANLIVFFFELSLDPFSRNYFMEIYGLVPARLNPATLITSMFIHAGWLHIIGNMWFLWIFGDNIEDILGRWKYIVFYLAAGVAAGLAQVATNPYSRLPTVGASGAIAGVMGAYIVTFPRARILTIVPIFILFTWLELPAAVVIGFWFVMQLFSGVASIGYSQMNEGGTAWWAHIGGFLAGIALIKLLPTKRPHRRRPELYW